jgi:hypothetical protein
MDEVRSMVRGCVAKRLDPSIVVSPEVPVRFIYCYPNGTGTSDIGQEIDRVEVEIE